MMMMMMILQSNRAPQGRMGPLPLEEAGLGNSRLRGASDKHKPLPAKSGGGDPENKDVHTHTNTSTHKGRVTKSTLNTDHCLHCS